MVEEVLRMAEVSRSNTSLVRIPDGGVTEELAQLKQISGNAVQRDVDNRRLVEESENFDYQSISTPSDTP